MAADVAARLRQGYGEASPLSKPSNSPKLLRHYDEAMGVSGGIAVDLRGSERCSAAVRASAFSAARVAPARQAFLDYGRRADGGVRQNQFAEGNPLFGGGRPGRAKLYSILGSVEIGELWAEHHLKARSDANPAEGRWKWWSIAGADTGFHATAAIHNSILLSNPQPRATKNNQ